MIEPFFKFTLAIYLITFMSENMHATLLPATNPH
jgi:hypothetical protein